MLITGCAMPYKVPAIDEARVFLEPDGTLRPLTSDRQLLFAPGCFARALGANDIEIVVNHVWKEHLASARHGLMLRETHAGLYFDARLPETPFAQSIYESIAAGKVKHVCALSAGTETHEENGILVVTFANLRAINLLVNAPPHQPNAWVMAAGPQAERRIKMEEAEAQRRELWSLESKFNAADVENALKRVM